MSDALASFAFEQLEPSAPPPLGTPQRLLADAAAQAEQLREQARAEGYAEGLRQGRADGAHQTESAGRALADVLTEILRVRDQTAAMVERDAVELALALAAKILAGTLEAQPERVVDVVRGALRRVSERRRITVLVDPSDLETVNAAIGELQAQAGGIELCEVQADRRVGAGGAIVRTAEGEVDASVKAQLERAREVLLAELQSEVSTAC
ncbi:MAG TPA: FliH/SctL family protein [Solirubrobacteraceae bacterium]|nr:FliH/SctL family protein [Solirubrobacteraceae bacterium]